jgi:hypothetical protein
LKFLFGTADAHDPKRLSATCDKLQMLKTKMAHAIEHQMTYIHAIDETTRQNSLEKQARYSAANREIETAIQKLKFSMIQLQESLDVTSLGQLSIVLINPYNLSVILQQVSLQLPAGLSMLTGLTVEDMYVYYTIATVHAIATSKTISLFVDIPLKATDRYFE